MYNTIMKPNIIFYFSDQQRYDTVNETVTPNLYRYAKTEGIELTDTHTCQPVCGPARACIQSGLYASKNGCYKNDISLNEKLPCLAKLMESGGYDTAYVGKWHLASDHFNHAKTAIPKEKQGGYGYIRMADCLEFTSNGSSGYVFDSLGKKIEFNGVRSDCINGFATEYIENRESEKPFFLFISQLEPHHQNDSNKFECAPELKGKFDEYPIPRDLLQNGGNAKNNYSDYLALCNRLDKNVEELAECLRKKGLWENTIIVYTADHGCHFRTRNLEYKRSAHDNSTHIPFIIFGGGLPAMLSARGVKAKLPLVYDELFSLIDFTPTLLDMAGTDAPKSFDGYSLLNFLRGSITARRNVFIEISESQLGKAIRTKDYIYSVRAPNSLGITSAHAKRYRENLLYELKTDSDNMINLVKNKKYKLIREKLRDELLTEIAKTSDTAPIIKRKIF